MFLGSLCPLELWFELLVFRNLGLQCSLRSGAPSLVLAAILGAANVRGLFASEINRTTAFLLNRNAKPQHIFEDAADTFSGEAGRRAAGFCFTHAKCCNLPREPIPLFLCGFSCKANSRLNSARHSVDPATSEHSQSFVHAKLLISERQPTFFVLEDVEGLTLGRPGKNNTMLEHIL